MAEGAERFSIHFGRVLSAGGRCRACGEKLAVQENAAAVVAKVTGQSLALCLGCLRALHDGLVAIVALHPDWLPAVDSAAITEKGPDGLLVIDRQGRLRG